MDYGINVGIRCNLVPLRIPQFNLHRKFICKYLEKELVVARKNVSSIISQTVQSIIREKHIIMKLEENIKSLEIQIAKSKEGGGDGFIQKIANTFGYRNPEKKK